MITRINLIEKKRFQATYGTIATALGGVILFSAFLYLLLMLSTLNSKKAISFLRKDIERLKQEREQIIRNQAGPQGQGPILEIQTLLEKAPSWSSVLNSVTQALPPRVWLASLKSAAKEGSPSKKEIIINGQAKNAQVLASFLTRLEKNPDFEKVVLTTSSEEAGGLFQFTISCDIGVNRWISKP